MSGCNCLSTTQRSQIAMRGEVMQTREPCPVHGELPVPPGMKPNERFPGDLMGPLQASMRWTKPGSPDTKKDEQ